MISKKIGRLAVLLGTLAFSQNASALCQLAMNDMQTLVTTHEANGCILINYNRQTPAQVAQGIENFLNQHNGWNFQINASADRPGDTHFSIVATNAGNPAGDVHSFDMQPNI